MFAPRRTILTIAIAIAGGIGVAAANANAADGSELTLYRSDSASLYASSGDGPVDGGYAVVLEKRALMLVAGTHDVVIGDLPTSLDAEALALGFPGGDARVISQRLLLARGQGAALTGLVGHTVDVLGSSGQSLASGTLLRAGDDLLIRDGTSTTLITRYAGVRTTGTDFPLGSSLSLRVDASRSGSTDAVLSYPTSGMGWRAAYVATLQSGNNCRMQFESHASIANRSGRDWKNSRLALIAGEPNFAKTSAPRPMMMKAARAMVSADAMPEQSALADYRSYSLPSAIDLPDGSVSQVPLYATRTIDCQRTALFDNGNSYVPEQPMVSENFNQDSGGAIISTLKLRAFDSLPAGYLRVLTADKNGTPQFIGEGRIDDTAKGSDATITLGTAFDLHAERMRTKFSVDKAGHTLDEAFRIVVSNAGGSPRTVTVREHPNRWREWTLASSSIKPGQQTTDTLEFKVDVPASGKTTLDYALHYHWTADDKPQ